MELKDISKFKEQYDDLISKKPQILQGEKLKALEAIDKANVFEFENTIDIVKLKESIIKSVDDYLNNTESKSHKKFKDDEQAKGLITSILYLRYLNRLRTSDDLSENY